MTSKHTQTTSSRATFNDETHLGPLLKIEDLSLCKALVISPNWPDLGSEHAIGKLSSLWRRYTFIMHGETIWPLKKVAKSGLA